MKRYNFISTEFDEKIKIEKLLHKKWIALNELNPLYLDDLIHFVSDDDTIERDLQIYISQNALERWHTSRFINQKWKKKPDFLPAGRFLESYIEETVVYDNGDEVTEKKHKSLMVA